MFKKYFIPRSKNGSTPVKFGRYQRNIVTFSQSFIFIAAYDIVLSFSVLVLLLLYILDMPVEASFYFLLIYYMVLNIMKSVIIPLFIIRRSHSRLPQLFSSAPLSQKSDKNIFYVRRPEIRPRQLVSRPVSQHPRCKH